MHYIQRELQLAPYRRGFHLITNDIIRAMPELATLSQGLLHVFIKHSSASLTVNENADPTVRGDFERFFSRAVPENEPYYQHNDEGPDDMPAHLKASLLGSSVTVPVTAGRLNMGIWQGVYLGEHRDRASGRTLVLTLHGS